MKGLASANSHHCPFVRQIRHVLETYIIYQRCIDNDHVNDNANGNVNQLNVKVIDDVNIHVMRVMDNRLWFHLYYERMTSMCKLIY